MIQAIQLSPEFVPNTTNWAFQPTNVTTTRVTGVVFAQVTLDLADVQVECEGQATAIGALIAKREADPRKAAALARARQRHALSLKESTEESLATLRLAKGMSQSQLAVAMSTKQPYVARIERGEDDLKFSTMENLAQALQVPIDVVFKAIAQTRAQREASL